MATTSQQESPNTAARVLRTFYAVLAESIQDPDTLALQLYASDIISRDVRQKIIMRALTREQKNAKLLDAVESQLATNPVAFDVFFRLLKERPYLAAPCGMIEKSYHPLPAIVVTRARVNDNTFPYLDMRGMNEEDRLNVQGRLLRDCDDIRFKFCDLILHAIQSLTTNQVSVVRLRIMLSSLGAYTSVRSQAALLQDQMERLRRAQSIEEIFDILSDYYSFFNYGLIERIIRLFGTQDDRARLDTYIRDFRQFCMRRTFQCPPNIFGRTVESGRSTLVVKVEQTWDPQEGGNLYQVLRLRNTLADILGVIPEVLYLWRIDRGCVKLLFQVPAFVEQDVFPLSPEQESRLTSTGTTKVGAQTITKTPTGPSVSSTPQNKKEIDAGEMSQQVGAKTITKTPTSPSVSNTPHNNTGSRKRPGEALTPQKPTKHPKNQGSKPSVRPSLPSKPSKQTVTPPAGVAGPTSQLPERKKKPQHRCGECEGCKKTKNCGECEHCKKLKQFGGPGINKAAQDGYAEQTGGIKTSGCLHRECDKLKQKKGPMKSSQPKADAEIVQKLKITELQDEVTGMQKKLEERTNEVTQLKETEKEVLYLRKKDQDQTKQLREQESEISQLQTTAKQQEQSLLEEEREVVQLKEALKQNAKWTQEKETEISQIKSSQLQKIKDLQEQLNVVGKQQVQQLQQKDQELGEKQQRILQLEAAAKLQESRFEQEKEQLRKESREQATKLQEKEQQIGQLGAVVTQQGQETAELREQASQSTQLMKIAEQQLTTLQAKEQTISQLELAGKQHAARMEEKRKELTETKEALNISEQLKKIADLQLKTLQERLQETKQLDSASRIQVQQKEQEVVKLKDDAKQQTLTYREKEQEVLHLKEELKNLDGERAQLTSLIKQLTSKIEEQQKMLQDDQKELAQLRESGKKEVQVKLKEQERKLKDWLTAIPVHGIQVVDLPLQ